ncbi:amidohydrolase family protein [Angustibacter sp. McL0619]|uniref:amidohydrolase family protein n=1 Tax=Angustibacter sp. McL0619 TaxID=3415676 RepID=UPI003CE82403
MQAIRAAQVFDGESFLDGGATVLVQDGRIVGVEGHDADVPHECDVTEHPGTLLPGLIDAHTHLVTDSGPNALGRVAGYSDDEIDEVITKALADQLAAGVTTVRDLGDRDFCVVRRRDRQRAGQQFEPTIVASGPPITTTGGHCHYLGGEVDGATGIARAIADRAAERVDVVKVMASGGVNTPGTDVMQTQFTNDELRSLVELAHAAGLAITAHAHGTPAVEQAVTAGVDGIEHCTCVTERGFGQASDELVESLARSGIIVCPTLGVDREMMRTPPPPLQVILDRFGMTFDEMMRGRGQFVARLHRAGVRLISGVDSGIEPGKRHGLLPHAVRELVEAGLTCAEALATGTSLAAAGCGVGDRKGRIRPGWDADLLLVEGALNDGLDALRGPHAVLLGGNRVPV